MDRLDESHGFLYEIYFHIKCKLSHIWEWPGDRLRDLKHYHQRGIHGVSNCDCWGLYDYLLGVKIKGLQYIKKYKHGCPCLDGFGEHDGNQTEEEFEAMYKEWGRIVDEMIWTFETAKKISEHDLIAPQGDKYFTKAEYIKMKRFCIRVNKRSDDKYDIELNTQVMSKKDFDRYQAGWAYYKKHFFSLWD